MAKSFSVETIFALKDQITGPVGRIKKSVSVAFTSMGKSGRVLNDVFSGVLLGNIATKAIGKIAQGAKDIVNSIPEYAARADEIGKTAQKLGMGTEALQKYRYAAELANVDTGTLNMAFMKLGQGMGNGTLVTALEKIDKGLAGQVKNARSTDEAFRLITDGMKNEGDVAKRTAVLMTAFGKAGNNLVPMLGDLDEQLANASKFGNIITPAMINRAQEFNDTVSRLKMMWQGFNDVIRSAVVQYITPLLGQLQEWAATNRELITQKIGEWVQGFVDVIQNKVVPIIKWLAVEIPKLIKFIKEWGPLILIAVGAWKTFGIVSGIVKGVAIGIEAYRAATAAAATAQAALTAATEGGEVAQLGLNAAMLANPIGIVVAVVAAAVAGFILLSSKVGGFVEALKVVGLTALNIGKVLLKVLVSPITLAINFVLDLVQAVVSLIGNIPGLDGKMAAVNSAIQGYQNSFNDFAGLDTSDFKAIGDPYKQARAAELERQSANKEIAAAATDPELLDALNRIGDNTEKTAENTEPGDAAKSKAPGLYGNAGQYDIFGTVRAGI